MNIKSVEAEQLKCLLEGDSNKLLIDVRELHEWQTGHIKQACHIPMGVIAEKIVDIAPDKQQAIILQCRSGHRSMQVAQGLAELGYCDVSNVEGGILAWRLAGYPIEQS